MAKKIVKRRKLRVFRLLSIIIVMVGLYFLGYYAANMSIKNIIISNTNYLNDDYIINLAGLKNYPSFLFTKTKKCEKLLESSPYIVSSSITKKYNGVINIDVVENRALFTREVDSKIYFSDDTCILVDEDLRFRVPRLINYVPEQQYKDFVMGMKIIKENILEKISDIEYVPNELDKDRFLLYMDDGNMVYLTLTKFKMINYYNDVLSQLEGRHGILYLDNGNHFQIKE